MSRIAFTVKFADGSSKEYSRNFPEGETMALVGEFVATRPYCRQPVSVKLAGSKNVHVLKSANKPVQEAKPVAASKPAPVSTRATKADLLAKIAELEAALVGNVPAASSAPVAEREPRTTQTRAERKAAAAAKKAADAKPATMHRHDEAMSNPTYAKAYDAAMSGTDGKGKASHVTATMRAWKAMAAEFEASTRKAGKGRKAA